MASLQKNIASQKVTFCLVDSSTGAAKTTATFTASAWVTVDGSQAGFAGSFTTLGNGQYQYAPTQGETNGTDVGIFMAPSGAVPVNLDFHTDQVDANGLLKVDTEDWKGTGVSSPATSGIPDVNAKNINNVATTSVTTINANQGTTQPVNFTGTAGSALVKSDMVDIAGSAVSTSTAQIGVNIVNISGSASTGAAGTVTPDLTAANGVETGLTVQQALRLIASTTGAKMSGGGTGTETFRNAVADSADRVIATVDSAGNRSAITYNL